MFTEQRKIRSDRPIDPEDEDQAREAAPRVRTVRRLIERDRPGAGTLTLADYVANGHSSIGSVAAAARAGESRQVLQVLETKIFVAPGTVACTVARQTLTFVGMQYDQEIYSDLGDGKMMDLYQARLKQAEYEDQMSQLQGRRVRGQPRPAIRSSEEATTFIWGKDPLVSHAIAVCAVVHVTDDTLGNPVSLGRTDWFSVGEGEDFARQKSMENPAPQRFLVFDADDELQSIWQSGQKVSLFTVEAEEAKETKARGRASMSARARRMAAAAHRAKRAVEQSPGEQTFEEFVAASAVPQEQVEVFRTWLKRAPHWSVTLPSMTPEEWAGMWWLFKGGVTVASQRSREADQHTSTFGQENRSLVVSFMQNQLRTHARDFTDSYTGEVDLTQLAEFAAGNYDIYDPALPSGSNIPEWVFEVAFEVADSLGLIKGKRPVEEQQSPKGRKLCYKHHSEEFDKLPNIRRGEAASWTTVDESECEICQADSGQEAQRPVAARRSHAAVRGPVEGEVVWLSGTGEAMTIQEFDWPNETVVLAGASGQKVVSLNSLRYFGSSGIDWMQDEGQVSEVAEVERPVQEADPAMDLPTYLGQSTILSFADEGAFRIWLYMMRVTDVGAKMLSMWEQYAKEFKGVEASRPVREQSGSDLARELVRPAQEAVSLFRQDYKTLIISGPDEAEVMRFVDFYVGERGGVGTKLGPGHYEVVVFDPFAAKLDILIPVGQTSNAAWSAQLSRASLQPGQAARLIRELVRGVERGDLVDFGAYGRLYVVDPEYRGDWWWVTNVESQRFNRSASGHSIEPYLAERIIQKWDDMMLPVEPEDYEGYLESARGQTVLYNAVLGDGTVVASAPAHSRQEALEALGQELRAGDRAVYIDWLNEGQVEQAPDPTLEEAFAWTGHLAGGVAAGRVDEVQIDPDLMTLIETLDREVREDLTYSLSTEDDWDHARQWLRQNYMRAKDRIKPGNWSAIDLAQDYANEFVASGTYAGARDRLDEEALWVLQSIVGADKVDYWTG